MDIFFQAYEYAASNPDQLVEALMVHVRLVAVPLAIGLVFGLPFGWLSSKSPLASTLVINSFSALRVIPSLAILFLTIPYFGLSFQSAAIALTILVMPPILITTDVAFRTIEPKIREAAYGMGMTSRQVLLRVDIPLALPAIVAGIKTATVEVIASATLAAFIGAGGFGSFIILGFALYDNSILLVGAIPVAIFALFAEVGLSLLQRLLQPPSRRSISKNFTCD